MAVDEEKKSSNESVLLRSDAGGIASLILNRGDKFNALSTELMSAFQDELNSIAVDSTVRVVVISGNGPAFCAGHDLKEMLDDPDEEPVRALFQQCSRMMVTLTRLPQPVIARVHGIATAAGCQLVAQCDLAVAAEDARFGTSGINAGLFCGTPMVAVTRNLPRKQAMELLMTGEFIDAETAQVYGLINRVVPIGRLDEAVAELAGEIASKGPAFVAAGKRLFYRQIEDGIEAAYEQATEIMVENIQMDDARAGIDAFLAKRPMPKWKDR